jgi:hypothetical protein
VKSNERTVIAVRGLLRDKSRSGVWTYFEITARASGKPRPSLVPEGQRKTAGGERSAATGRNNENEFALARAMESWISI